MGIIIAGAILSGPAGVMLLLGYAISDLVSTPPFIFYGHPVIVVASRRGSQLVGYLLLAIPAVLLPQLARSMAEAIGARFRSPNTRLGARAGLYAAISGALVYLWAQGMVVLIRPAFTWRSGHSETPTVAAIHPVQFRWGWLVLAAVAAVIARIWLEDMVARRSQRAGAVSALELERWEDTQRPERGRGLPAVAHAAVFAAGLALLLAGTYRGWFDAFFVLAITGVLGVWRAGLLFRVPAWWERAVARIPAVIRYAAAVLVGYWLTASLYRGRAPTSFAPLLFGALLTVAIVVVLFPPRTSIAAGDPRETT
jgi:hypothetical protein